jgi:hypothetical protein
MLWERWKAAARSFLHCLKETTDRSAQAKQQAELSTINWGVYDRSFDDLESDPGSAPRWLFVNDTEPAVMTAKEGD